MTARAQSAHVVVVGGGATGAGVAHDLALRGLRVTLLERGELTSGTTGRHHGLLHSGGRYAVADKESAVECIRENRTLRKIAPGSFEENGGLFVALTDEDLDYLDSFLDACDACGIPTVVHKREDALRLEPGLNPAVKVLLAVEGRFCGRVLNRLHPPADGDIIVPQRALSIVGTTSWVVGDPDVPPVPADHVATMYTEGAKLVPALAAAPLRAGRASDRERVRGRADLARDARPAGGTARLRVRPPGTGADHPRRHRARRRYRRVQLLADRHDRGQRLTA